MMAQGQPAQQEQPTEVAVEAPTLEALQTDPDFPGIEYTS
jgi:hypothetical protein